MEAVVGTMIPFIGGGLGSIVTRKNIKTWYPVRVFFFTNFLHVITIVNMMDI